MSGGERRSSIPPVVRLELQQRVTRTFLPNLTPAEFVVLTYILDRTIMWGRARKRISICEFENGNRINGGVPLSRRSIITALGSLQAKGVILAEGNRRSGKSYGVDFAWPGAHIVRTDHDESEAEEVN